MIHVAINITDKFTEKLTHVQTMCTRPSLLPSKGLGTRLGGFSTVEEAALGGWGEGGGGSVTLRRQYSGGKREGFSDIKETIFKGAVIP